MGPNVQSGKTRWVQASSLAKMAWDQMSMGPIVWLPLISVLLTFPMEDYFLKRSLDCLIIVENRVNVVTD